MVFISLKETMNFNQWEICLARATLNWLQQTDLTVSTYFILYFIWIPTKITDQNLGSQTGPFEFGRKCLILDRVIWIRAKITDQNLESLIGSFKFWPKLRTKISENDSSLIRPVNVRSVRTWIWTGSRWSLW